MEGILGGKNQDVDGRNLGSEEGNGIGEGRKGLFYPEMSQ